MTTPLKILIVEDEALLAMDMSAMVEDTGHEVVAEAASLREVEAIPQACAPDLAFVDMQLAEGSNGLDVCRYIRGHWSQALIIFVTANPKIIPADFAGGHGVISKPFTGSGLKGAIRYITEGIIDPPPCSRQPSSFTASPSLTGTWEKMRS